jgi:hypothetical protein
MVDNVAITAGAGTTVAADDISSVYYQRVKLSLGADGSAVDAVAGAGNVSTAVQRVTLAADDPAVTKLGTIDGDTGLILSAVKAAYETVAAAQTAQVLGGAGAAGDYIAGILVVPATTSPGNVLLLDNATSITVFAGGASSVSNLVPFFIPLGMVSASGAWKITTGSNVSCIGIGNFTA